MNDINIIEITKNNLNINNKINKLLNQLSSNFKSLSSEKVDNVITNKNTILLGAFCGSDLVGILSLICVDMLTQKKALIEDVVVDSDFRGKQIGKKLMLKAHELAKKMSCSTIHLTSRPSRVVANNLYQSLGYKIKETNYYILTYLNE